MCLECGFPHVCTRSRQSFKQPAHCGPFVARWYWHSWAHSLKMYAMIATNFGDGYRHSVLCRWWTELVVLPACYEGQRLGRTLPGQKTLVKKNIIIQSYPDQSWVERIAAKDADAPSQVSTVSRRVQPLTELAIKKLKALLRKMASQSELALQDLHTASESMKLLDSLALPFREALRRRHFDKNN
eukprot:2962743-Amphidinium_carterae.1